ncbi:Uncharacterized protein APZ42_008332, partial [Daphnia magna]
STPLFPPPTQNHAMAQHTPGDLTLVSSAIDQSMEVEECNNKRKQISDNPSARRVHPRFSDLFDQPISGAPVIIHLTSEPKALTLLSLTEKKHFINALINIVGTHREGTKWTHRGDLNIYPTTNGQKKQLLELKSVKEFQIYCTLAMSESIIRGIIRNVPINNSDEELAELLADQGVTKTQRFSSMSDDGTKVPSQTVTLFFNTPSLPRKVVVAHEIFQVKQFIPRPALCRRCWNFGHPEESCKTK